MRLFTKIVCTIGPASREPEMLTRLMRAGMDVARLNFSHGDSAARLEDIQHIRAAAEQAGKPVAILGDLQGPKLRVGTMQEGGVLLTAGETLTLTTEHVVGAPGCIPVQYEHLPEVVEPQDRILIDDGLLELVVTAVRGSEIIARVVTGGLLDSNKGLNLPRAAISIPAITEKDREDLAFAIEQDLDWIALSFVRTASEVWDIKAQIRQLSAFGRQTPVVAKIEKPEAIDHIDDIIAASDGIMVARGDLGIEISPEAVPMLQKMIITKCNQVGKPVITATQMLDSMIRNPRPTRAEASDVANAILDGSDAIMLSGETATGKYPLEAVQTMARIAQEVERVHLNVPRRQLAARAGRTFAEAVAHASVETALDLSAAAIVTPTVSGATARTVSRFRPPCPIVAVTPRPFVQRELVIFWGVFPLLSQRGQDTDTVLNEAVEAAQRAEHVKEGDVVVVTGGSVEGGGGTTNLMKVHLIEHILARGLGLSDRKVIGRVRRLEAPVAPDVVIKPDEIVVTSHTDRTFLDVLHKALGLITTDARPGAHCRLAALELGLPTIVGVQESIDTLTDGMHIVMDTKRGLVYERPPALWRPRDEAAAGPAAPRGVEEGA
ncbi:MAG: Pyruvate kinase [Chloroflexi bacterium ADurb.Bin325]|nr:MAG: Pyruvate kinase [Chloroflexi bacterium ADurb.Bin325]